MNSSTKFYNSAPVLSLLLARIFYSANWFNVASIFYLIATDFKQDISTLGLVTSSLYPRGRSFPSACGNSGSKIQCK